MIDPRDIGNLINVRKAHLLTVAEAALPQSQFKAFRKIVLDELGRNGLEGDIQALLSEHAVQQNG
ncbi:hypothetical protein [Magnetospira sp. QH-2]|uniref:hypothetical protein n=1 Tax=Magnetospira sp. (strain QH-2) TaxID=1288970 RepID=UPI0005FA5947|nr:hypothetical protein [Magnetospira sp. QH-2]